MRFLRVRQRLTQATVAARAGVPRRSVSMLERGAGDRLALRNIEAITHALGARMDLRVLWNGPQLDRLLDEQHAAVAASVKRRLERWAWQVRVEVSYSRYGERGRIDLLAFHPTMRVALVVEVKTELVDVNDLLGTLDQKHRLARHVAGRFGWAPRSVVPAIVFLEHSATRKRLALVDSLFDRFALRGRAAVTWLRNPSPPAPSGVLWFTAAGTRAQVPKERVRPSHVG